MQAQPRGNKRGAKENIDVGGKKPKKEEREKESKPFVCAIYRRDIANFLPREKIQQWRLTSSHNNASLIEFPSELPRFKYLALTVIFASSDRCIVQKNGFLDASSDGFSMEGKEFDSIFKLRFCCRDDRARELVGQRLFPNKLDIEGVAFKLYLNVNGREKKVVCRVPNLLTKKTAPAMLHFLYHLSQACYGCIEIFLGATADAAECALNPLVLQALPKFRLRGVKFGGFGEISNRAVNMASEMRIHFNLFYYRGYFLDGVLAQLLDFIANGRQLDKRLELEAIIRSENVDQIVKYFEEDVQSLQEAIRDVRYESLHEYDNVNWPEKCPSEAAAQVTERDDGTVEHLFDYTNEHTKEPFSLLLGTRHHEGHVRICKFHLTFGSA